MMQFYPAGSAGAKSGGAGEWMRGNRGEIQRCRELQDKKSSCARDILHAMHGLISIFAQGCNSSSRKRIKNCCGRLVNRS